MDFGDALKAIREGRRMRRFGWRGKGMWVALTGIPAKVGMTMPFLFMRLPARNLVPWTPSQPDLLADDWEEFDKGVI